MRHGTKNIGKPTFAAVLAAGILLVVSSWRPPAVLAQSCTWGGTPSVNPPAATALRWQRTLHRSPGRIAVDGQGNIYTTEPAMGRIVVTNPYGGVIDLADGFLTPSAIAIDNLGNIYVGERETGAVSVFDAAWNFRHQLGQGSGEFAIPSDIAIDPEFPGGAIYVADGGANLVKVYSPTGGFQSSIGGPGSAAGLFNFPAAVYVSPAGELFVADHNNDRIQVFDRSGTFLRCFGRKSIFSLSRKFGSILGLTGDALGRVYVADAFQGHVKAFDAQGVELAIIGGFGDGPGELRTPAGLAVDPFGRLLVASVNTARVELFGLDEFSDPGCASDLDCPSNDGNPCTTEICVSGMCLATNVESAACSSCDDCFDNDGDGLVDSEDSDCATLTVEAPYALLATATGTKPAVVLDKRSQVDALPGEGGCAPDAPYPRGPSRAQVCAQVISVMDGATIDGSEPDPVHCLAARQALPAKAALVAALPATNKTIDDIAVDRSAAGSACLNDSTSTCPTLTLTLGGGLQVLVVKSVLMEQGTQLIISGQPDTVLVVRVLGGFRLGSRAAIGVTGGLAARRILWSVEGPGADLVLGDDSRLLGTVMTAGRTITLGRRGWVRGALFGKSITLKSKSTVKHTPFLGLLAP